MFFFSSNHSSCSLKLVRIGLQVWCSKPKSVLQLRLRAEWSEKMASCALELIFLFMHPHTFDFFTPA